LVFLIYFYVSPGDVESGDMSTLTLSSPMFGHMSVIPQKYTCDGEDVSPPLVIDNVPEGTESLALIMDDPDAPAGTWVHWVVWNISPGMGNTPGGSVPPGAVQGKNSWGRVGYGGPCPPSGTHRYFFKLYALDSKLALQEGATKGQLEKAMKGHLLEEAELVGLYTRKR
jgi:hypothetical protein